MKAFTVKLTNGTSQRIFNINKELAESEAKFFFGSLNVKSVEEDFDAKVKCQVVQASKENPNPILQSVFHDKEKNFVNVSHGSFQIFLHVDNWKKLVNLVDQNITT